MRGGRFLAIYVDYHRHVQAHDGPPRHTGLHVARPRAITPMLPRRHDWPTPASCLGASDKPSNRYFHTRRWAMRSSPIWRQQSLSAHDASCRLHISACLAGRAITGFASGYEKCHDECLGGRYRAAARRRMHIPSARCSALKMYARLSARATAFSVDDEAPPRPPRGRSGEIFTPASAHAAGRDNA